MSTPQEKRGQKKCEDEAEFVDGDDLCHLPHLQRLIIAQPACPCGKAGEHEEHKASAADVLHAGLRPGDEHHAPGHHKHEDGADGRGQVGIDALDADLAEDRRQAGEQCGKPRVNGPHEKAPISLCGRARPHRAPLRLLYSSTGQKHKRPRPFRGLPRVFFCRRARAPKGVPSRAAAPAGPGPIPHMRGRRFPAWGRCSRPGSFARAALWPGPEARGPLPRARPPAPWLPPPPACP